MSEKLSCVLELIPTQLETVPQTSLVQPGDQQEDVMTPTTGADETVY